MKKLTLVVLALASVATTSCASIYTSITPVDNGHYIVTSVKNHWIVDSSRTYNCVPEGDVFHCRKIADP